ncbi:methionyl-tRNA formyltransferase [Microlunatus parietis]|uniref:Methionyl-tRNA formyltransferase n=1 Tax=Microlunatus parietis TaxID=682979 RepID=A0A7Y9I2X0_9ACTN|nr:methionyl-tRNA formyltransferase [Microlunatus parietis]NYE69055.1 methionyl-tRNA formyltransferase [Microlunatus parietis]
MRLVFAGTPEVALPALNALVESDHEVVAVITRPDAPSGRGRTLHPSPVAARAAELGLETLKPERAKDPALVQRLTELAPDCCPVVAYGALLPQRLLDIPPHGWVNLHFSLLPAWRGAAPVQHAVLAGDQETGACTFRIVKELDAGPVFDAITEPIGPTDTAGDLLGRLAERGAGLLVATMDALAAGTAVATPQPETGESYAAKLTVEDGQLDWQRTAVELDRQVRGCQPAPGAWTTFRGDRFKINSATPVDEDRLAPGELRVTKKAVVVGTGAGALDLGQVQAQGKKPMRAADWARGVTFAADDKLG